MAVRNEPIHCEEDITFTARMQCLRYCSDDRTVRRRSVHSRFGPFALHPFAGPGIAGTGGGAIAFFSSCQMTTHDAATASKARIGCEVAQL